MGLIQVLSEFGSNALSSVNNRFRHMITNVLIQKVLTLSDAGRHFRQFLAGFVGLALAVPHLRIKPFFA
jgi:hypothetical protein